METGQMVKWVIGGRERRGIFMQQENNQAEVMCISFEGVYMAVKTLVALELLQKA
jgi:hypothetical protein